MAEKTPGTSATERIRKMSYTERLANYEREKMQIPRLANDSKTYEQAVRMLAKKWRI